jgi:8-oxo-dGTP pyrophosphatase MutT (NUDIX family)
VERVQHLRRLLGGYRTADAQEQTYRQRMTELLEAGDMAFARSAFAPGHFTASAFVVSPDSRQLLLILHAKLGLWLQPGGHVDPEDTDIVAAARRELREEVGLEQVEWLHGGIFDVDVHAIAAGNEPAHEHFDVRFLFRSTTQIVRASSDARDVRWVPLDEVATVHSDASVMRAVQRLRHAPPRSATAPTSTR